MVSAQENASSVGSALSPVCNHAVSNDLCIGCGVCAAVCPTSCLSIEFNSKGEYTPVETIGCSQCGKCGRVCPFGEDVASEDSLSDMLFADCGAEKRPDCGYFDSCYVGHSTIADHRARGASGGLANWTLERLLRDKVVDRVITSRPGGRNERLYEFAIIDSIEQLRNCAGSCYYPLELSGVLKRVLVEDARYAVIGLPCFIKALRLAALTDRRIAKRIVFHAGLVCGSLMNRFYAEYVTKLAGGDPNRICSVSFRSKHESVPATNPLIEFWYGSTNSEPDGSIYHLDGCYRAWQFSFFRHNSCNYCDDVFAELADITFMDAWLPKYASDPKGTSLLIVRSKTAAELIEHGIADNELSLETISADKVVLSQAPVLKEKRDRLAIRLALRQKDGMFTPCKRVLPADNVSREQENEQRLLLRTQQLSKELWPRMRKRSTSAFHKSMPAYRRALHRNRLISFTRKMWKKILSCSFRNEPK